ncbi:MAG: hypothetical protein ABIJ34_05370 [archaeon]
MTSFGKLRRFLIKIKLYIARTGSYISLINTVLILFLFLSDLKKYGIYIAIKDWIVPLFIMGVLMMVLFGYIEEKLGFYSEEQRSASSRNPYMKDIIERLDRIEKKLYFYKKKI